MQRRNILRDLASAEAIDVVSSRGTMELWGWLCERHSLLRSMTPPMPRG
jgi:hypothetical protein